VLDCSLPPGQPPNSLCGYWHLGKLTALSQRNISVEERAERIQLELDQNAKDLGASALSGNRPFKGKMSFKRTNFRGIYFFVLAIE
jgi:hypothetical protein